MAIIKQYQDSLGYPHLMQVLDKDTPAQEGYELSLNFRYWLETESLIPTDQAVKIAQGIFNKKWYYAHDITNVSHRHDLYILLKNALRNEEQAKLILTELVYKLTKEGKNGG